MQFFTFFTGLVLCGFILSFAEIETKVVQYEVNQEEVSAYLAAPKQEGNKKFPAILMIHEWWGLNPWIKANADKFAQEGYVVLALDLYRGKVAPSSIIAHELMRGLPEDQVSHDIKVAFDYLAELTPVDKKKIGVIGWCMGGGYALKAVTEIPSFAACVFCYGRLITDGEKLAEIRCPVLAIFGREDRGIAEKDVLEFEKNMKRLRRKITMEMYDQAGHAFMNPSNSEGYRPDQTDDAWKKIGLFLETQLKQK